MHTREIRHLNEISGLAKGGHDTDETCLICNVAGLVDEVDVPVLVRWLSSRPCPVIGVVANAAHPLVAAACDVVVPDAATASEVVDRIDATPKAAMVLAHLLRATEGLPVAAALTMESMAYGLLQAGPEHRAWLAKRTVPKTIAPQPPGKQSVRVSRHDNVLEIVLDRPDRRNAVCAAMRDALYEALTVAIADSSIERVDLSGAGGCFSIGGDLEEFGGVSDPVSAHGIRMRRLPARFLAACADRVHVKVHSACIGAGAEMAAFAKHVVAAENAFFHLPELEMGVIPGAGGCVSIPRRIGRQRAAYMALSGKRINARTALAWGLVDAIDPDFKGA